MAAIRSTARAVTAEYRTLRTGSAEANNCTQIAVSVATGLPLEEVTALFAAKGRERGARAPRVMTEEVLTELGFKIRKLSFIERRAIIEAYPGVHKGLQSITTHHPERFAKVWGALDFSTAFLFSNGHVSCLKDGAVHDWAKGRALRVIDVWAIEAPEASEDAAAYAAQQEEEAAEEARLNALSTKALREECKRYGVKGYANFTKAQYVAAILAARAA